MKKLCVIVLMHPDVKLPDSVEGMSEKEVAPWKTEYDVVTALEELGHETVRVGADGELATIRSAILESKAHILFNLLEEFRGEGIYTPYVLGYCELMRQPFTGCNPPALIVADNKALMKKILRYHRIPTPDFAIFPRGRVVQRPSRLSFPLIVKSSTEHGSVGIAQASVVSNDEKLKERVAFIHEHMHTDAIAESYIEGRELYVGVLGNRRLETLPIWEILFSRLTEGAPRIATEKVKFDLDYQKKLGITTQAATGLPTGTEDRIRKLCKRAYRILGLSGYARMDFRLRPDGKLFLLEPNPNPDLALDEDFAESAHSIGIAYEQLIQRIVNLGLRYHARPKE